MKFYILHFLCFTVIKILDFIKQKTIYSFIMLWKNEKTYWLCSPFPKNNNKKLFYDKY